MQLYMIHVSKVFLTFLTFRGNGSDVDWKHVQHCKPELLFDYQAATNAKGTDSACQEEQQPCKREQGIIDAALQPRQHSGKAIITTLKEKKRKITPLGVITGASRPRGSPI